MKADRKPGPLKGEWPLPGQNNRYMSQAELPCDMANAPKEHWTVDLGRTQLGAVLCADVDDDGELELLYGTYPLICTNLAGTVKWRCVCGAVTGIADIDADGHTELLAGGADEHDPVVIGGEDGKVLWRRTGSGIINGIAGRYHIAKLLPEVKGLQIACVTTDFDTDLKFAQVWSFADGCGNGKLEWERKSRFGSIRGSAGPAVRTALPYLADVGWPHRDGREGRQRPDAALLGGGARQERAAQLRAALGA